MMDAYGENWHLTIYSCGVYRVGECYYLKNDVLDMGRIYTRPDSS